MAYLTRAIGAIVICAATLTAAAPAEAQSTKLEKARELFEIFAGERIMDQMLDAVLGQMSLAMRQQNPNLPAEVDAIIHDEVKSAMMESIPGLLDEVAVVYERVFTEEELDGMLEFYRGPVGQAFIAKMPVMMNQTMQMSQEWGMDLMQSVPKRVEQRLRDEGYDL